MCKIEHKMSVNYQNIEIMCRKQEEQSAHNASKSRCEQEETIGGHFISSVKLEYKQARREGGLGVTQVCTPRICEEPAAYS